MEDSYYSDGYDMACEDGSAIWSCGYKYSSPNYMGVVSVSFDAGASWTRHELYSGTNYGYVRAVAVDPSNTSRVFCLGYENSTYTLYYTENEGSSWNSTPASGYTGSVNDILVSPWNGDHLAAASGSGLFISTDGGSSWSAVSAGFSSANQLFTDPISGDLFIATGDQGVWLMEDWTGTPVQAGSGLDFPAVNCVRMAGEYLFAGTAGNSVWRVLAETGISHEDPGSTGASAEITISPNPISSQATISFTLPRATTGSLAVYDLTGRRVMEVSSGDFAEGSSSFSIAGQELAPGLYFARFTGEGMLSTARMVITR